MKIGMVLLDEIVDGKLEIYWWKYSYRNFCYQ
jgi:hypothetical protein